MEPAGRRTTPNEQKLDKTLEALGERAFALAAVTPFLREQFKGPAYERGYPERYPRFKLLPSAAVVRDREREPPELRTGPVRRVPTAV
jgi:hypothetical protein